MLPRSSRPTCCSRPHSSTSSEAATEIFRSLAAGGRSRSYCYSHGTLQQRFTNDTLAENLARRGYLDGSPAFDAARGEYRGQTFDPFFLLGSESAASGTINPVEVALTLDRVGDYRAALKAARRHFGDRVVLERGSVGLIGYSRGGMHGLVGAELISEVGASVSLVGGTPLLFYARDAQAAPINEALERASPGRRDVLDRLTKPVLELIGGEDSRRKASTDVAAAIGVYPTPSQANPSPIVRDTFDNLGRTFGVLVQVTNAMFDRFIGQAAHERRRGRFDNPFAALGVTLELNRHRRR